jgi:hypothetical protein
MKISRSVWGWRPACRRIWRSDVGALFIVEGIIGAMLLQPGARLLHRVAVLDVVDGDGHGLKDLDLELRQFRQFPRP